MWNSGLVKIIRWLLYIPITLLVIGLIERSFFWFIGTILGWQLSLFWLLVFLFILGGLIWGFFQMIAQFITLFTIHICPNKNSGGHIFASLTGLSFLSLLYSIWQMPYEFTFYTVIFCVFVSFLALQLGGLIISMALSIADGTY